MSTSTKSTINSPLIPSQFDTVLDVRTRCSSREDFGLIDKPYLGMLIYTTVDNKLWIVTELGSKTIGITEYKNATIKTAQPLAEFIGSVYTGSDNISVSSSNVIDITDKVALKTDIKTYTAGENIDISTEGVISCTGTPGSDSTYTEGDGISISDTNIISVDFNVVANKSDIKSYIGSDNIIIGPDGKIDITDKVALKSDLAQGDATSDYRQLSNKPKFVAGEGINLNYTYAGSLLVTGATDDSCNGIYAPTDYYATGTDRVWAKEGRFIHYSKTAWYIDSDIDTTSFYYSAEGDGDPWTLEFNAALDALGNPPTVTVIEISEDNDHCDVQVDWNTVAKKSDIKNYSGSTNISISSEGKIDITDQVALASDIVTYKPGAGIAIDTDGTISCSVTPGEPISYTAGDGLLLNNQQFTVDWEKVAKLEDVALKSDIKTYTAGQGIEITNDNVISCTVQDDIDTLTQLVDETFGDMEEALDIINKNLVELVYG
jgi:hypothetical protein